MKTFFAKTVGLCLLLSACTVVQPPPAESTPNDIHTLGVADTSHVVQSGDTLYAIARRYSKNPQEIAADNALTPPYSLTVGQLLRIRNVATPVNPATPPGPLSQQPTKQVRPDYREQPQVVKPTTDKQCSPAVTWQWPAQGKVADTISSIGHRGLLIHGFVGQTVRAAASGQVIYSGTGQPGYPNLIIIKHNNAFISVYAQNRKQLVSESARVIAGQAIAEMGDDNSGQGILQFEIRCHGKAMDAWGYLPRM